MVLQKVAFKVDGVIYYEDVDADKPKKTLTRKIVVQVKSGRVSVKDIRELKSVVETQDAVISVASRLPDNISKDSDSDDRRAAFGTRH